VGLPAWKANLDVGHRGTYSEVNGGEFGKTAVAYFKWVLKRDTKAKMVLTGNPPGWWRRAGRLSTRTWSR